MTNEPLVVPSLLLLLFLVAPTSQNGQALLLEDNVEVGLRESYKWDEEALQDENNLKHLAPPLIVCTEFCEPVIVGKAQVHHEYVDV